MLVIRKSPYSGKMNSKNLLITQEEMDNWKSGMKIQDAMPNLTLNDREFIMSGLLSEEWDLMFGNEE